MFAYIELSVINYLKSFYLSEMSKQYKTIETYP